jgi:hypothetical protein
MRDKIKIFLSEVPEDIITQRRMLKNVLVKAGMDVMMIEDVDSRNEDELISETQKNINNADCTVHILGNKYGRVLNNVHTSLPVYQFNEAKKRNVVENDIFKMFAWQPFGYSKTVMDVQQEKFVNSVRNSMFRNMVYSNQESPVIFVEDIHAMMHEEAKEKLDIKDSEVFFIYNELDEDSADGISDLLSDVVNIERLGISQDSTSDYLNQIVQQSNHSKLLVVYFKRTSDWAMPFIQQVWKRVGGASANTELLMIGDSNLEVNLNKKFNAPKVTSLIVAEELIPIEIKVHFDKITESI